jgi:hypothetical protein
LSGTFGSLALQSLPWQRVERLFGNYFGIPTIRAQIHSFRVLTFMPESAEMNSIKMYTISLKQGRMLEQF